MKSRKAALAEGTESSFSREHCQRRPQRAPAANSQWCLKKRTRGNKKAAQRRKTKLRTKKKDNSDSKLEGLEWSGVRGEGMYGRRKWGGERADGGWAQ